MPIANDAVWISVLPDMSKFGPTLSRGANAQAANAGQKSGSRFTDGFKQKLKIATVIGTAMAAAAGGKFLKESIREASDLGESLNAVEVTFGKNAAGIKRLGEEAANAVGLSNTEFNGLAVQFSAFATTIAGKGGNVVDVMQTLTTRGADFASVMNLEVNEAMTLFQSGLAGETEPLRKFGIDLSAAAVEAHAYKSGIAEAGTALTENQKVQARYSLLMKQTSKTQDDFANTSDSLANSQRILGANFDNIQATVGAELVPILEKLSSWFLNTGLPALKDFGSTLKDNKSVVADIGIAVGALVAGMVAYSAATKTAAAISAIHKAGMVATTAATTGATVSTWSLNAALRANPIGLVVTALTLLGAGLVLAYKKSDTFRAVVDGAWVAIRKGISLAWNYYIKPVFTALKWYISNILIPTFRFLWEKVIKPVFGWIGRRISDVWNGIIKPVFATMRKGAGRIADVFGSVKDRIGRTWSKLGGIVQKPIDAAIRIINGFIKLVNKIPGVELPLILGSAKSAPKGVARGALLRRATGGPVFGPGTETSDSILARLSNNEHVLTAKEVAAAGGHRAIEAWRAALVKGKAMHMPGFAKGGRVISYPITNNHGAGYYGATSAWDAAAPVGTPVRAWKSGLIATVRTLAGSYGKHIKMNHGDGTSSLYAHLSRFLVRAGQRVAQGAKIALSGNTGNSTGPHLHAEFRGGHYKGGGGGVSSIWDKVLGSVKGLGSWFSKRIKSALIDKVKIGGLFGKGGMRGMLGSIGGQIRDGVKAKLFDNGGWLMPGQSAINLSSKPEPVFSSRQWEALSTAIRPSMGSGSRQMVELAAPVRLHPDDMRQLEQGIGDRVLAGAGAVARGLDERQEFEQSKRARYDYGIGDL